MLTITGCYKQAVDPQPLVISPNCLEMRVSEAHTKVCTKRSRWDGVWGIVAVREVIIWGDGAWIGGGGGSICLLPLLIGTSAFETATDAEAQRERWRAMVLGVDVSCQVVLGRFTARQLTTVAEKITLQNTIQILFILCLNNLRKIHSGLNQSLKTVTHHVARHVKRVKPQSS